MSGTQMQNAKEKAAEIMRQKQAAGKLTSRIPYALNQGRKKKKGKNERTCRSHYLFSLPPRARREDGRDERLGSYLSLCLTCFEKP